MLAGNLARGSTDRYLLPPADTAAASPRPASTPLAMLTIVLRLLHVVLGAIWVGAAFVVAFFLFPSIRSSGPAGGAVMRQIAGVRKMPVYLTIIGWVTVLSGLTMYLRDSLGANSAWGRSPAGITYGVGGTLAIVAIMLGTFWNRPTADKMTALGAKLQSAGTPPPADLVSEMTRVQDTFSKASKIVSVLVLGAAAAMSIARYL